MALASSRNPSGVEAPGTDALLREALHPIEAVDPDLFERSVAYVRDGNGPELLQELEVTRAPDAAKALQSPGRIEYFWVDDDAVMKKLRAAGFKYSGRETIRGLRRTYYASDAPLEQFVRLGRLFACLGDGPDRQADGVPPWLTALTNDVARVAETDYRSTLAAMFPAWTPARLEELARIDGIEESLLAPVVLRVLMEFVDSYPSSKHPSRLSGVNDYLITNAERLPADAASKLRAHSRVALAERMGESPELAAALAPMLMQLVTDRAKTVRTAAARHMGVLEPATLAREAPPVLLATPASKAEEIVEFLTLTDEGTALLSEAVAAGAPCALLVEKAAARRTAVLSAPAEESLAIPAFVSIPDVDNSEILLDELRRGIAKDIAAGVGSEDYWPKHEAKRARKVTDDQLLELIEVATGARKCHPTLLKPFGIDGLLSLGPSFTLTQSLRIVSQKQKPNDIYNAVQCRITEDTDLRAIEEAEQRAGLDPGTVDIPWFAIPREYGDEAYISPEAAWPWFAEHPDALLTWLNGEVYRQQDALTILEAFPSLPSEYLPRLAVMAVSTMRATRPRAQALLARHGVAFHVALQGLEDGKKEVRAASAAWVATLGDPAAIPALNNLLARERAPEVRAAVLTALEVLGEDIGQHLSPEVLLAEARAGLARKLPSALEWLNLDLIPEVTWADGTAVDPQIVRWWVVLAEKMKSSDGSGLIDRYLSLLDPESAAAVGRFTLSAWVAQDTARHTEENLQALAETYGLDMWQFYQDYARRWRGSTSKHAKEAQEDAKVSLEERVAEMYASRQSDYAGSAIAHRGLLALSTRIPGGELSAAVASYLRQHAGRRAQADALMYTLFANGQPPAIQLLLGVSLKHRHASVQKTATALAQALADQRGWSADELADRTIPTAGFTDDCLLHLSYGPRAFVGRVDLDGKIQLSTEAGKPIKALPAARVDDDADLVKETKAALSAARKEAKSVMSHQSDRLYEAMCTGRSWPVADWSRYLAGHPLVGQLVSRLVWLETSGDSVREFRPTEDGALIDLEDSTIELAPDAQICLAHRMRIPEQRAEAWRAHLEDYALEPPFDQFAHGAPSIPLTSTTTDELAGHITDTFTLRTTATKRGYKRGRAVDGGYFFEYIKQFSSVGLEAVLSFTGNYLPEENIPCATTSFGFRRGRRAVSFAEAPEVLLAECYGDYQALAALGPFDPNWEENTSL